MQPVVISEEQIVELKIGPTQIRECVEKVFADRVLGTASVVPKVGIYPVTGGLFHAMPAAINGLVIVKWLTVGAQTPKGAAALQSTILATDAESGQLVAVLDGKWVTAVRTAAVTAIAARFVFGGRPIRVSFVGGGVQALSHVEALCEAFQIDSAKVLSRTSDSTAQVQRALESRGIAVKIAVGPRDALEDVDLVVTSISLFSEASPFLDARLLRRGSMVSMVDLGKSWIPETCSAFTQSITDDLQHTAAMKTLMRIPCDPDCDLPGLITGSSVLAPAGDHVSLLFSPGLAITDAAVTEIILERLGLNTSR